MKKTIYSLLAFVAASLVVSCQKNEVVESPEAQPNEVKMITVSCTLPTADSDTKVTLTNDGEKGKTAWVNGDEVFFHGKYVGTSGDNVYSCVASAHDVSADGKTAYFTIPDLSEKYDGGESYRSSIFAAYPASAIADYTAGAKWYYISAFKNTNNLLLAACNDFDVDEYSFKFFNLTGALSFKVDGSSFGGFDKYIVEGNNGETIGWEKHSVSFATLKSSGSVEERYRYKGSSGPGASSGALTTIVVTPSDDNWDNGTTVNTVYFPGTGEYDKAAANFTKGFTIKFYKNDVEVKRISTKTAKNITVGKLLDLGDVTSHLYTYVPPATHDSSIGCPADGSDYDLSKSASANCYIVDGSVAANANKVFKFKAYKGKGTTEVGKINSVQVLWETWNNAETVSAKSVINAVDYDKQESNAYYEICFKMPETIHAGNALIAAKDDLGNILWSWHIWVPATTITSSTYGGISTSPMMDRNVGALVIAQGDADTDAAIESVGMYYQWGRKDPFPGTKSFSSSSMASVSGSLSTREKTSYTEIYKYPNQFVITGADSKDTDKDWSTENSSSLWVSSKNENDPCPPGWKLPYFTDGTGDLWDSAVADKTTLKGWAKNTDHHWFRFGVDYDALKPEETGYVYFPYGGYRTQDNGSYSHYNDRAHIWQAKGDGGAYARLIYAAPNAQYVDVQRKGRGGNVRCVAE